MGSPRVSKFFFPSPTKTATLHRSHLDFTLAVATAWPTACSHAARAGWICGPSAMKGRPAMKHPLVRLLVACMLALLVSCGGDSGPSVAHVNVDSSRAVKATITSAGGTITATGSNGVVYTLTIPADALIETTEIGLAPIDSIDNIPFNNGLSAGFQLSPDGLQFSKPASLAVQLAAPVQAESISGFIYEGDGKEIHLQAMDVNGSTLTFAVYHFSGGGAAINPVPLPTPGSARAKAEQGIAILLNNRARPPAADAIADILRAWYTASVKPGLQGATTDPDPLRILDEYRSWMLFATQGPFPNTLQAGVELLLEPELGEATTLAINAMQQLITQSNQTCSLSSAKLAIRVMKRAVSWNLANGSNGLGRDTVLTALCLQVDLAQQDFPQTINAGQSGTLTLKVGYKIGGGATKFDQPFMVSITPSGAIDNTLISGATDGTNNYQTAVVRKSDSAQLRLDIKTCFADLALSDVCAISFVVRGVTPVSVPGSYAGTFARTRPVNQHDGGSVSFLVEDFNPNHYVVSSPFLTPPGGLFVTWTPATSSFQGTQDDDFGHWDISGTIVGKHLSLTIVRDPSNAPAVNLLITFSGDKP